MGKLLRKLTYVRHSVEVKKLEMVRIWEGRTGVRTRSPDGRSGLRDGQSGVDGTEGCSFFEAGNWEVLDFDLDFGAMIARLPDIVKLNQSVRCNLLNAKPLSLYPRFSAL